MLYFTYVVRPGEAPEGRGPLLEPVWENLLNYGLRIGLGLQLFSYLGLLVTIGAGTGKPLGLLQFFKLSYGEVGSTCVGLVIILTIIGLLGLVMQLSFADVTDDDSSIKQSRGFRAGTKLLYQGSLLGIIATSISCMNLYAANRYFNDQWYEDSIGSNANAILYTIGRFMDAVFLITYSGAFFLIETYHSDGVGEIWGYIIGVLFKAAAICEVITVVSCSQDSCYIIDGLYTILLGAAIGTAFYWSTIFEPISHRYDVKLSQSAMRTEFYKSKNAMAYYGPAVVNAEGEIDVQNAMEQAQAQALTSCRT